MRTILLVLAGLGVSIGSAYAQDSHYWNNQYGTKAELLGGLVVGSVTDLSTTFYNPGALSILENPSLLLTTDAIQLTQVRYEGAAGTGVDLNNVRAGTAPSIFAVQIDIDPLGADAFAVSVLTRFDSQINFSGRGFSEPTAPTQQTGEVLFDLSVKETWAGVSWSKQLNERVGIGTTVYGALRTQSGRLQTILQQVTPPDSGRSVIAFDEFSYWHTRLLAKIGAAWHQGDFTFGITGTTPSLGVLGSGSAGTNLSGYNLPLPGGERSVLTAGYQEGLDVTYKSPASLAVGVAWTIDATTFYSTAEWFAATSAYELLGTGPIVSQTEGDTTMIDTTVETDAVVNVGVGVEHRLSDTVSLYGSVITDNASLSEKTESKFAVADWDNIHVSAGSSFMVGNFDFTVGLAHGRGDQKEPTLFDVGGAGLLPDQTVSSQAHWRRWKLVFGFDIEF